MRGDPAALVVVDPATGNVDARVDFPVTYIASLDETPSGELLASVAGNLFEDAGGGAMRISLDGALYRLTPGPGLGYTITGTVATEQELRGTLRRVVATDDTNLFVQVDAFIGEIGLYHVDLSATPAAFTPLLEDRESAASFLCKSSSGSIVLSGSQMRAQFGADGVGFIDGSTRLLLNQDLVDPGFRPETCAVLDAR